MSTPRKHHYLPKSYLAAWTDSGDLNGKLQVIDRTTGRSWSTRPINAAKENDLYMIDISEIKGEINPTEIEETFGAIESRAIPVIKEILAEGEIPDGAGRDHLMEFLAVLALRVPSFLNQIDDWVSQIVEGTARLMDANGELPKPDDPEVAASISDLMDQGLIQAKATQNYRMTMMVQLLPELMSLLAMRTWVILRTADEAGELITTDSPVSICWTTPGHNGASPGFGSPDSIVFVPLGPSTALYGLWEVESGVRSLSADQVAGLNGEMLGTVKRFVISRGDFSARHRTDGIDRRDDVLKRWDAAASKSS